MAETSGIIDTQNKTSVDHCKQGIFDRHINSRRQSFTDTIINHGTIEFHYLKPHHQSLLEPFVCLHLTLGL